MEQDLVSVHIEGRTFVVNRVKLAENMNHWRSVAKHLEKRPGEPTDHFTPNDKLSADKMAVMTTIIYKDIYKDIYKE